jgi:hypothetical protein
MYVNGRPSGLPVLSFPCAAYRKFPPESIQDQLEVARSIRAFRTGDIHHNRPNPKQVLIDLSRPAEAAFSDFQDMLMWLTST